MKTLRKFICLACIESCSLRCGVISSPVGGVSEVASIAFEVWKSVLGLNGFFVNCMVLNGPCKFDSSGLNCF